MDNIYLEERQGVKYPTADSYFNPSISYPEYMWTSDLAKNCNEIYDMVRTLFRTMGLDAENFGKKEWNPLGEYITAGDTVLIKPNMVLDRNMCHGETTESLITNPSLVRAVTDYVIIALKGSGKVQIADAPVQSCDFEKLCDEQGYYKLIAFYKKRDIDIELLDLRAVHSTVINGVISQEEKSRNGIVVQLDEKSMHYNEDNPLRITCYNPEDIRTHHNKNKHEYMIASEVLQADVVINLPKPKTHRKAGITAAQKNLIGVNSRKEYLPHHTLLSKEEGGDEYQKRNGVKRLHTYLQEKVDICAIKGKRRKASVLNFSRKIVKLASLFLDRDGISEGNWYGNETIAKTVIDVNKIVKYANKEGVMCDSQQRKLIHIGDMIISGEKEGPLMPSEKYVGCILASSSEINFDKAVATLMGFNYLKIPTIYLNEEIKHEERCYIYSSVPKWNNVNLKDVDRTSDKFKPSKGWEGYL